VLTRLGMRSFLRFSWTSIWANEFSMLFLRRMRLLYRKMTNSTITATMTRTIINGLMATTSAFFAYRGRRSINILLYPAGKNPETFIYEIVFTNGMAFSKSFPKQSKTSTYPQWEEVALSDAEERLEEDKARVENIRLMKECIADAAAIVKEKNMKDYQTDIIHLAISLFEKRASHSIYWKESKAKEKFDALFK
jgi:hypothetical protein